METDFIRIPQHSTRRGEGYEGMKVWGYYGAASGGLGGIIGIFQQPVFVPYFALLPKPIVTLSTSALFDHHSEQQCTVSFGLQVVFGTVLVQLVIEIGLDCFGMMMVV